MVQLNDINNTTNSTKLANTLNTNNERIEQEFDQVLYADGRKALTSNLDANGKRILNIPAPQSSTDPVRLVDLQQGFAGSDLLIPSITGNKHRILSTDGTSVFWRDEDVINLKRYGTTAADIQTAINASVGKVLEIPAGIYTIDVATITIPSNVTIICYGAVFRAAVNNQVMFTDAGGASYYTKIFGGEFTGNGFTGVVAFSLSNWRLTTVFSHCIFKDLLHGIILQDGTYAGLLENLATERVKNPVRLNGNCGGTLIFNPAFDNGSSMLGDGTGIGVAIKDGLPRNTGVKIIGGYIQGFQYGVADEGYGTNIDGTYFEECSDSDIFSWNGAIGGKYENCKHFAAVGTAAYKFRNSDGMKVVDPLMASSGRLKLLDLNGTVTNTQVELPNNAFGYNSPVGDIDQCQIISAQTEGTFTPTIKGTTTAGTCTYNFQNGKWTRQGDIILAEFEVSWTGHTGTGGILIEGIPGALTPSTFVPRKTGEAIVVGAPVTDIRHYAWFNGTSTNVVILSISAAGVESFLPIPTSGTIYIRMHYSL